MSRTNMLTKAAMLAALATAALCAGAWLPRGGLALTAIASLFVAAALIACGPGWAAGSFAVSLALGFLLCPDKTLPLWYGCVLGHYPIFKHYIERFSSPLLRWALKLLLFAACIALVYFLFSEAFAAALPNYPWYVLLGALGVVFILYDIAFSRLIGLYLRRVHRAVQKGSVSHD